MLFSFQFLLILLSLYLCISSQFYSIIECSSSSLSVISTASNIELLGSTLNVNGYSVNVLLNSTYVSKDNTFEYSFNIFTCIDVNCNSNQLMKNTIPVPQPLLISDISNVIVSTTNPSILYITYNSHYNHQNIDTFQDLLVVQFSDANLYKMTSYNYQLLYQSTNNTYFSIPHILQNPDKSAKYPVQFASSITYHTSPPETYILLMQCMNILCTAMNPKIVGLGIINGIDEIDIEYAIINPKFNNSPLFALEVFLNGNNYPALFFFQCGVEECSEDVQINKAFYNFVDGEEIYSLSYDNQNNPVFITEGIVKDPNNFKFMYQFIKLVRCDDPTCFTSKSTLLLNSTMHDKNGNPVIFYRVYPKIQIDEKTNNPIILTIGDIFNNGGSLNGTFNKLLYCPDSLCSQNYGFKGVGSLNSFDEVGIVNILLGKPFFIDQKTNTLVYSNLGDVKNNPPAVSFVLRVTP